jgi:hypothetical protein
LTSREDSRDELGLYVIDGFAKTNCADFLGEVAKILDGADVPLSIMVFVSLGFFYGAVGSVNADVVTFPTARSKRRTKVAGTATKIS